MLRGGGRIFNTGGDSFTELLHKGLGKLTMVADNPVDHRLKIHVGKDALGAEINESFRWSSNPESALPDRWI